jgi:phage baseplate assembly protein V
VIPRAALAADQRIYGVVIGIVKNVNDEEGLGRVQIELPWYASGYRRWARVAHLSAGPGYGSTWVPEEKAEVLVAFAHGDMRWPYVLGALYGNVDKPQHSRSSSSDIRTLRTPSGAELTFDETKGEITLKTPKGASVTLAEKSGEITVKATSKITLSAPDVHIEATGANGKVTVKGQQIALN